MKQRIAAFGITALIFAAIFGFTLWDHNRPESSGRFEITGTFVSGEIAGKQRRPSDDRFIIFKYQLEVSDAEIARISAKNTGTPSVEWKIEGDQLWQFEVRSTGNWCGPLPDVGALVTIKSGGFTSGVKITDLESGEIYKSTGKCSPAKTIFHYRIVEGGSFEGLDKHDLPRPAVDCKLNPSCRLQVWADGEEPPPLK